MRLSAVILVMFTCCPLAAQPLMASLDPAYRAAIVCADSAYQIGEYQQCGQCYEKAFAISGNSYASQYKAARCYALAGDTAAAFSHLRAAIKLDFEYACTRLQSDMELENLRQSAHWYRIEAHCALCFQQIDQGLQRQLDSLYQEDQRYRGLIDSLERSLGHEHPRVKALYQKQAEIDERNLRLLAKKVLNNGYPGKHMVGRERQFLAFVILQHANGELMKLLRAPIAQAVANQDLPQAALAITDDIIAMRNKKPQLYGTQVWYNKRTRQWELWKVKAPETLDERRKTLGLEPIAVFLKRTEAVWEP